MSEGYGGYVPPKLEPRKRAPKKDPVYIATGSFLYRFKDGTYLRLTEGEKVDVTGPRLTELKKFKHVKEVK
jgi:hypothetical protein